MAYKQVSPIPVVEGGTGATTFGDGHVLLGSGTSPLGSLDVTAKGSILVGDGTTAPIALPVGLDGEVLSANSSTPSGLEWGTNSASGTWEFISTATASASATVEFTDLDATHFMYMVVIDSVQPETDSVIFRMRTSSNNGSSFDDGVNDYYNGSTFINVRFGSANMGNAANEEGSFIVNVINPSSSSFTKIIINGQYTSSNGGNTELFMCDARRSTTPVNAIQFFMSTGNIASGTFKLYGLRPS